MLCMYEYRKHKNVFIFIMGNQHAERGNINEYIQCLLAVYRRSVATAGGSLAPLQNQYMDHNANNNLDK
jgi:hypothetical protein